MTKVRIGSGYKEIDKMWVGIGGVWKEVDKMWSGIGGVWKEVEGLRPDPFTLVFTSSQTWTVPSGVDKVDITIVGGGKKGSSGSVSAYYSGPGNDRRLNYDVRGGNGGNGGEVINMYDVPLTPGAAIPIIIGASDGNSKFGDIEASAGMNGKGSGGGRRARKYQLDAYGGVETDEAATAGASNGGNSYYEGQGTSTYGINGILYSGGGGGGGMMSTWDTIGRGIAPANGGNGGGGEGAGYDSKGSPGIANTGGGGGGGYGHIKVSSDSEDITSKYTEGGNGGSGIIIVRYNGE